MIHIIAHRGASAYEPENTLRAFECAIELGATMMELDVHLSRDGEVVVIHDPDLSRTTDGAGRVGDLTLAEIRRFDAGKGERVPTLAEVIELVRGRAQLYIELKGQQTPGPVVGILRETRFLDQAIAGSFFGWLLLKCKYLEPRLRTSFMVRGEDRERDYLDWVAAMEAEYVHPCWERFSATPHELLPPELVAQMRSRGLGIILWHEERPAQLRELVKLDVDGICTNTPDILAAILVETGGTGQARSLHGRH